MRLLCLHGYGTNASVLENQLQTFLSQADQTLEPLFVDGEIEAPKARNLGAFAKGPFYCYYDNFAPDNVKKAHEMITDIVEDEGPFDGILGFSQGGSLAVAYLLQHEIDHPKEPPPFKFGLIFSSIISFTPDENCCKDLVESLSEKDIAAMEGFPDCDIASLSSQEAQTLFGTMAKALKAGTEGGFLQSHPDEKVFERGDLTQVPRILHPELIKECIRIPTVHVVGKSDDPLMLEQSSLMHKLCDPSVSKWIEHSGGHDIPRQVKEAKEAVKAMEWAVNESQQQVRL